MARLLFLSALACLGLGCAPEVDLKAATQVKDVTTGWYDAGVVEGGKNKLVPSLAFQLENTGGAALGPIQFNVIFRRIGDPEEWSTALVRGVGSEGLAPGAATSTIVVRAPQGYTSDQPRLQMLQNRLFVDAKAEVFAKHKSAVWVKIGEFPIRRVLLTE